MAASGTFCQHFGTAANLPSNLGGSSFGNGGAVTGITNMDWKNVDDYSTAYSSSPITAGNNSYDKYVFMVFTGSFNMITGIKFNHTYNTLGTDMPAGFTIKAFASGSGLYRTPATTAYAALAYDLTSTGSITTGIDVKVGGGHPAATGKNSFTAANPAFTDYIGTQLQTSASVSPGDFSCGSAVWTLSWIEN